MQRVPCACAQAFVRRMLRFEHSRITEHSDPVCFFFFPSIVRCCLFFLQISVGPGVRSSLCRLSASLASVSKANTLICTRSGRSFPRQRTRTAATTASSRGAAVAARTLWSAGRGEWPGQLLAAGPASAMRGSRCGNARASCEDRTTTSTTPGSKEGKGCCCCCCFCKRTASNSVFMSLSAHLPFVGDG